MYKYIDICVYIYIRIIFYFDVRPSCRGYRVAICVPWSRNMVQYMGYGQPKWEPLCFPIRGTSFPIPDEMTLPQYGHIQNSNF